MNIKLLITASLLLGLSACHGTPYRVKQDYGTSANTLLAAQTVAPGEETADLDGNKGEGILEYYRETNATDTGASTVQIPIGALLAN